MCPSPRLPSSSSSFIPARYFVYRPDCRFGVGTETGDIILIGRDTSIFLFCLAGDSFITPPVRWLENR